MKFYKNILIVLAVIINIGFAQHLGNLEDLLETNLQVQAAKKAYESAKLNIKATGTLPDPMVEASFSIDPIETRNGPIENQIMVGQKFPLWGKLKKERSIQKLNAEISRINYNNIRIQVAFLLRKYLAEYYKHDTSLRILNEYLDEIETFTSITRSQYANGISKTMHPILKLQIEQSILRTQINNTESLLAEVVEELETLFNDHFSINTINTELKDISRFNDEQWIEITRQYNPQFLTAQTNLAIAQQKHQLTKLQNFPDLTAGVTYSVIGPTDLGGAVTSGQDAMGVKIGFNIPLWFNKNRARVNSASLSIDRQETLLEDTWNNIEADLKSILTELDAIDQNIKLYSEKILDGSEQMLNSAYSAYEVGNLDYLDLLDSIRLNFKSRIEFEHLMAKQKRLKANLLKTAGLISLD